MNIAKKSSNTFASKDKRHDSITTPCILWKGCLNEKGFGWRAFRGGQTRAHRAAWIEKFGDIPRTVLVLHKCNNRACVNLDHLYLGDNSDNTMDAIYSGTHARQKLTIKQVREIRYSTEPLKVLVARFKLNKSHICHIRSGKTWGWLV